jgi:hypothetical protein
MFAVSPAIPLTANNPGSSGGGRVGVRYPSPFFDLAQSYIPQDLHSLFRWCRYYALTYGPIYTYVQKMASYGLTRLVFGKPRGDHSEEIFSANRDRWEGLLENKLDIYPTTQRLGMHYFTYGNGYSSIHFPFRRHLVCPKCRHSQLASEIPKRGYRWKDFHFYGSCPRCKESGKFLVHDLLIRSPNGLRIKLWNPEQVFILNNEATDDRDYYYRPSSDFSSRIRKGERRLLENTPWAFIRAVQKNSLVKFDPTNFFHIKCPSPDGDTRGYGYPPILAGIKDAFHLQLMKRAQEAYLIERAIPFPIVHPVPFRSETPTDPMGLVSLHKLMDNVQEQIERARQDPNYIAMVPVPVGVTSLWGEGRPTILTNEIRAMTEMIVADLGTPLEFYFGGLSWTGSSVSLRMLENQIIGYRQGYRRFTSFIIKQASHYLQWDPLPTDWKPFKMADDIQQRQLLMTMSQMNKIGDHQLLEQFDLDADEEYGSIQISARRQGEILKLQTLAQAEAQIEAQKLQQRAASAMPGMPGMPGTAGAPPGVPQGEEPQGGGMEAPVQGEENILSYAAEIVQRLQGQPPEVIQQVLEELYQRMPPLAQVVEQLLASGSQQASQEEIPYGASQGGSQGGQWEQGGGQGGGQGGAVQFPYSQEGMMQPLPEQRPPRRSAGLSVI